ncbi:hypothetical protein LTS08_002834 [Lithohypha guttulata]|nr:hypothetical protein LTS08_002834 [Lithohypha guttulata]
MAIRAFNIEISRIPDIVSNTTIGQMRHQFWKDTINKTFNANPPEEPVATLLSAYMQDTGIRLNKTWLTKIVSAREQALLRPGFTNISELESYAESTYSMLLYLTLSAIPLNSLTADHVASHCGVREEDIYRNGGNAEGLRDAVFAVATRASDHLITARSLVKEVNSYQEPSHEFEHLYDEGHEYGSQNTGTQQPQEVRKRDLQQVYGVIMGPAISTQLWLDRLQKVDFDIFHNSLRIQEWKLPIVAWWRNRQNTF